LKKKEKRKKKKKECEEVGISKHLKICVGAILSHTQSIILWTQKSTLPICMSVVRVGKMWPTQQVFIHHQ